MDFFIFSLPLLLIFGVRARSLRALDDFVRARSMGGFVRARSLDDFVRARSLDGFVRARSLGMARLKARSLGMERLNQGDLMLKELSMGNHVKSYPPSFFRYFPLIFLELCLRFIYTYLQVFSQGLSSSNSSVPSQQSEITK